MQNNKHNMHISNNLYSNPVAREDSTVDGISRQKVGNDPSSSFLRDYPVHIVPETCTVFADSNNAYEPAHDLLSSTISFCSFPAVSKSHKVAGLSAFSPQLLRTPLL